MKVMLSIEYLRQFRLGEYALFDFTIAFLGMALLSPLLSGIFRKIRVDIPKQNWLYLALPIGILVHLLVGRITPMTKNFLDPHDHFILKVVILGFFILGMRNIKIIKKGKK